MGSNLIRSALDLSIFDTSFKLSSSVHSFTPTVQSLRAHKKTRNWSANMVLRVNNLPNSVKVRAKRAFQQKLPISSIGFDHNPVLADKHATIEVGTDPLLSQGLPQSRELYIACKHRLSAE